ncbi:MAG: TIGR04283 family arsenosugar biosynthesis glycosyltransferase [Flavobacteriaceae bacterium]|jgi:rSAM/selenodomain-associated transferase 2|nr:glycosyltransferase [Formosa sp.]MDG1374986.1 TIGR04283 family arsenosugar biosynthesis glycosyltransferase [Flavobacteriaceae bacterium]MDG2498115.1 TIGR04283 family arsenosugar biosynthesis glycosyltransferase [Flavobacteriaceae bacterium]
MNSISIIIPVLNEAENIEALLTYLDLHSSSELLLDILVVDGGSTDGSQKIVSELSKTHPKIVGIKSPKGRAKQMNLGASQSKGSVLYFLHADSIPPKNFDQYILDAVHNGSKAGCFKMKFDSNHWWLQLAGWFTQFNWKSCRGGDQSLFVEKTVFDDLGGFNEEFVIYEDNDLIYKLYKHYKFEVLPYWLTTSSRRYFSNGIWSLQLHFWMIHLKKLFGATPKELEAYYLKHIK